MLKDSFTSRLLIRVSIGLLRAVAPLSLAYCASRFLGWTPPVHPVVLAIADIYAASESLFFLVVYLPRRWWLNRPAPEFLPELLQTKEQRWELFLKTWESTPDPHGYVSLWFKGVPVSELCREDVKDWLSWRMFNKTTRSLGDEDELERYLEHTEIVLKHTFPPGRSKYSSMAVTFERVRMMHRPLIWYLGIIGAVDLQLGICMRLYGYRFHCFSFFRQFLTMPLRPFSLLLSRGSPSKHLSYWHLKHTSTEHIPVLFIHGIGVGLHFYLDFFKEFKQLNQKYGIGMIGLEILPISSRITSPILRGREMTEEIRKVLYRHGWSRCMVVSHSYGSVIATHLLRDPEISDTVGSLLLVDPVAFSFHSPEVPWNFLRRQPRSASEIQLQYFASMDPDVAFTLTRRFIWPDNSLWREEVEQRAKNAENNDMNCTVAISGRDIIVDTDTLGCYLTRDQSFDDELKWYEQENRFDDSWKEQTWTGGKPLEVIYFPERNHAEIFEDKNDRSTLLNVIEKYSEIR